MRGPITKASVLAVLATVALAVPTLAQQQPAPKAPQGPVRNWGNIFIVAYPDAGTVNEPIPGSDQTQTWNFGSGFGLGAAYARVLGSSLQLGAEASLAPSVGVEITNPALTTGGTSTTTTGHAKLGEILATGRIMTGGGGGLGLFLAGGAGFFFWGMPSPVDRWDPDLAFRTAAGLEYGSAARRALFLEWGQFWAYHQHSGVKSNTTKFSQIRGGLRIGW